MENLNRLLWSITTVFLVVGGIYFTYKLKGIQFHWKAIFSSLKKTEKDKNITPFKTLSITLAARIGVGSLAGVALSIYIGGIGTIFWMWVTAIICAANAFAESVLGMLYRKKNGEMYVGGPFYYIKYGMKKNWLANIYAILTTIVYIFGFLSIQSNTITRSIVEITAMNPFHVGILITIITALIILKGAKRIVKATSVLVPVMSVIFIGVSTWIVLVNIQSIPKVILAIVSDAFNLKACGMGILTTLIIGTQRGIFSNEAGIGTGTIGSSIGDDNNPKKQGYLQIFGIYFETLIISTLTALVVILSDYHTLTLHDVNGIEISNYAYRLFAGPIGEFTVAISVVLFAFCTITSGYYYGEAGLVFFTKNKHMIFILKIITLFILLFSSVMSATFLWNSVDILIAILGIINIITMIDLKKEIISGIKSRN